ncbi:glycosyltransferase family 4 protein [Exiguobacterium sp. SH5S13]|uniref:glycosyltransferase family 4 protein n=1 Tax=Exiguobacterium sp. SH5S13 TaxID=2510959 RepID=UPI001375896B|nr:glycosyltransferase family 4 protein [Exiguobacterium sp. SH5S13]
MKIFFMGDFNSDTGPSIANRMLVKGLEDFDICYSKARTKPMRIVEMIFKTLRSDCICFSSYSKMNFLGIKIANILNKKTFYIMHGYRTYEYKINKEFYNENELARINNDEKKLFGSVDKVFCVSKKFMNYMKKAEPEYKEKFDYNYNSIYFDEVVYSETDLMNGKKNNQIVSIGGGMKQKNVLKICHAIEQLNNNEKMGLKLIVIGSPYTDKDKICSYDFVTYHDKLPHKKVLEILSESGLYIQNSTFETFGLAVIEALNSKCNLLLSNNIGIVDLMLTIKDSDIIYDVYDENEIARKIRYVLENNNVNDLKSGFSTDEILYKTSSKNLYDKIYTITEER